MGTKATDVGALVHSQGLGSSEWRLPILAFPGWSVRPPGGQGVGVPNLNEHKLHLGRESR